MTAFLLHVPKSGKNIPVGYIPPGFTNDSASDLHLNDILQAAGDVVDGQPKNQLQSFAADSLRFTLSDSSMIVGRCDQRLYRLRTADIPELLPLRASKALFESGYCVRALQQKRYNCETITFLRTDGVNISASN